jgi:hypothetical protein
MEEPDERGKGEEERPELTRERCMPEDEALAIVLLARLADPDDACPEEREVLEATCAGALELDDVEDDRDCKENDVMSAGLEVLDKVLRVLIDIARLGMGKLGLEDRIAKDARLTPEQVPKAD